MAKKQVGLEDILAAIRGLEEIVTAEEPGDEQKTQRREGEKNDGAES